MAALRSSKNKKVCFDITGFVICVIHMNNLFPKDAKSNGCLLSHLTSSGSLDLFVSLVHLDMIWTSSSRGQIYIILSRN